MRKFCRLFLKHPVLAISVKQYVFINHISCNLGDISRMNCRWHPILLLQLSTSADWFAEICSITVPFNAVSNEVTLKQITKY